MRKLARWRNFSRVPRFVGSQVNIKSEARTSLVAIYIAIPPAESGDGDPILAHNDAAISCAVWCVNDRVIDLWSNDQRDVVWMGTWSMMSCWRLGVSIPLSTTNQHSRGPVYFRFRSSNWAAIKNIRTHSSLDRLGVFVGTLLGYLCLWPNQRGFLARTSDPITMSPTSFYGIALNFETW